MAFGGGDALRSRRLLEPQRAPPAYPLHHFELGNSWLYAAAEAAHRLDREIFRKVAADSGRYADESNRSGGAAERAEGDSLVAAGASTQPGTQPRGRKSARNAAGRSGASGAGAAAAHGCGPGIVGDR